MGRCASARSAASCAARSIGSAAVVIRTGVPDGSVFLSPMTLAEGPAEVRTRQEAVAG